MNRKEAELTALSSRLEDEQSLVGRLQRQIKELMGRASEFEEELDAERHSRAMVRNGFKYKKSIEFF